jgi:hypothetical protein
MKLKTLIAAAVKAGRYSVDRFVGILFCSNPRIKDQGSPWVEAECRSNPMISIHDLEALSLIEKDHRCMEPSCPMYELPRSKKALTPLSIFDLCDGCKTAMNMLIDDPLYDVSRSWTEACEASGDLLPLPRELSERLDRLTNEVLLPDCPESEAHIMSERPSIGLNERKKPKVKNFFGHLWKHRPRVFKRRHISSANGSDQGSALSTNSAEERKLSNEN